MARAHRKGAIETFILNFGNKLQDEKKKWRAPIAKVRLKLAWLYQFDTPSSSQKKWRAPIAKVRLKPEGTIPLKSADGPQKWRAPIAKVRLKHPLPR